MGMRRINILLITCLGLTACSSPENRFNEATKLWRDGDIQAAKASYREIVERFPTHSVTGKALLILAETAQYQDNNAGEAARYYHRAAELFPGTDVDRTARHKLGDLYLKERRVQHAIAEYQKLVSLFPKSADACDVQRAIIETYTSISQLPQALDEIDILIDNFDGCRHRSWAITRRGLVLLMLGRTQEAIGVYLDFLKKYPKDPLTVDATLMLADAYVDADDLEHAVEVYQRMRNEKSGDPKFLEQRIATLSRLRAERLR